MSMRKIIGIIALLSIPAALVVVGQTAPHLINFQGRLTDSGGQPFDGVTVDMSFAFYGAETGGTAYLSVLQEDVLVTKLVLSLQIGHENKLKAADMKEKVGEEPSHIIGDYRKGKQRRQWVTGRRVPVLDRKGAPIYHANFVMNTWTATGKGFTGPGRPPRAKRNG